MMDLEVIWTTGILYEETTTKQIQYINYLWDLKNMNLQIERSYWVLPSRKWGRMVNNKTMQGSYLSFNAQKEFTGKPDENIK